MLRRFGFDVTAYKKSPFEHLLQSPRYTEMTVDLLGRPFKVADAQSFYYSYREIFLDEIYRFRATTETPEIIDCGANYGLSVVYMKTLYPGAKITAVEADPVIFEILEWNMKQRQFKNLSLIPKAISQSTSPVPFFHEGADGGRLHALDGAKARYQVEPLGLDALLDKPVDLLKIDIEGAETTALCASENLANASHIFVEYHSFTGETQTLQKLLDKLAGAGFRYFIQTQFCATRPFIEVQTQMDMDMQLNIFARKLP